MDEDIELPPERLPDLANNPSQVVVGADIAFGDQRRIDRLRELADALLDPLALIGERKLRTSGREAARDRPRDRALVRDTEHEPALAFEAGHGGRVYGFSARLRLLRRFLFVPFVAALILASTTSAALQPVRRGYGERAIPRV